MKFIERVKRGYRAAVGNSALDERYWQEIGALTAAGVRVSPEQAVKLASVYACVRVISETIASFPFIIYRRLPDGGKERAIDHVEYRLLHDQPNSWQTSFEWVELMMTHLELRGNAYSVILPGPDSAIQELIPLHPTRVTVKVLPGNRLKYEVNASGKTEVFDQTQILHLRGQSWDGISGFGTVNVGSEAIGAGLGQQDYSARFWANDSKPGGVLEHPSKLSAEAYVRLKESFQEAQRAENRHKVAILEEGVKYTQVAISNKDSQFLETLQARRAEVCSLFRVPPHKIGDLTRATYSNIEEQNIEFATDCIRPRCVRFEKRINLDLIEPLNGAPGECFGEFLMDALYRGNLKARYEAYGIAIDHGWMSPNDARRSENMNPIADGDIYIRQMNTTPLGTDPQKTIDESDQTDDTAVSGNTKRPKFDATAIRLRDIAKSAAERCVRKEVLRLRDIAKYDEAKRNAALESFYLEHREFLMNAMSLAPEDANEYVNASKSWIKVEGIEKCIERISSEGAIALASLATGSASAEFTYLSTLAQSMRINQLHSGALMKKKITVIRDGDGRVSGAEVDVLRQEV